MTGSAMDPPAFQAHLLTRENQRLVKARAKDPDDPLEIVIVRDMWLTGFDAPSMHTMYVDKPMQGAGLMQAIARVNRTFRDKPGGLIVDYIGVAQKLREALADYSPTDQEQAGVPIGQVVDVMLEKHDIVVGILHGQPWSSDPNLAAGERLSQLAGALNYVLADDDRKPRFLDQVLALLKAFALAGAREEAFAIRDDVRFFADIRAGLLKLESQGPTDARGRAGSEALDTAIEQLVSAAIAADEVIDVYAAAGMERPDLSILSDAFLEGLTKSERPNLQAELLKKLINDKIRSLRKSNIVEARRFSDMLDEAIRRYQNRTLSTAEIIAELVTLAKAMRDASDRGESLGLRHDELAFYDAIHENQSAVLELGDERLKALARELVSAVRESVTIDWNLKETIRAAMRAKICRLLNRHGYPPDGQERAIQLVIEQAELIAGET